MTRNNNIATCTSFKSPILKASSSLCSLRSLCSFVNYPFDARDCIINLHFKNYNYKMKSRSLTENT